MRRAIAVVAALLAAWLLAAAVLFVVPHDDEPITGRADAVVSLAGSKARLPVARELVEDGVAPELAVSYAPELNDPLAHRVCARPTEPHVTCFRAEPFSTRGEARSIRRLAAERGWDDVVVVTSDFHVFRTRLLVERCYEGRLRMESAPSSRLRLPWAMVTETAKLGYALLVGRSC